MVQNTLAGIGRGSAVMPNGGAGQGQMLILNTPIFGSSPIGYGAFNLEKYMDSGALGIPATFGTLGRNPAAAAGGPRQVAKYVNQLLLLHLVNRSQHLRIRGYSLLRLTPSACRPWDAKRSTLRQVGLDSPCQPHPRF